MQTLERLDIPSNTFQALEKIARQKSITPTRMVQGLVQQYEQQQQIDALNAEYNELSSKALLRTIDSREEKRMNTVIGKILSLEARNHDPIREERERKADELIVGAERLLAQIER